MTEYEAFHAAQDWEERTGHHMDEYMAAWERANREKIIAEKRAKKEARRAKHPKLAKLGDALSFAGHETARAAKKVDKAVDGFMGGGKKKTTRKTTAKKTTKKSTTSKKSSSGRCSKCGQKLPAKKKQSCRR